MTAPFFYYGERGPHQGFVLHYLGFVLSYLGFVLHYLSYLGFVLQYLSAQPGGSGSDSRASFCTVRCTPAVARMRTRAAQWSSLLALPWPREPPFSSLTPPNLFLSGVWMCVVADDSAVPQPGRQVLALRRYGGHRVLRQERLQVLQVPLRRGPEGEEGSGCCGCWCWRQQARARGAGDVAGVRVRPQCERPHLRDLFHHQ